MRYLFFILPLLFLGCVSNNGFKYGYPEDIFTICNDSKNIAFTCVEEIIQTKIKEIGKKVYVEKVIGQKYINGRWAWKSPEWNRMWVSGLFDEPQSGVFRIRIGVDPKTGAGINVEDLVHENGHLACRMLGILESHPSQFKSCFNNWHDVSKSSDGSPVLKTLEKNGIIIHYYDEYEVETYESRN